jgi:hypothetical protein
MAEKAPHVSIVFCGGCNPGIDRGTFAEEIWRRLAAHGCRLSYNDRGADLLVFLSGCSADCARQGAPPGTPSVAVAGAAVDAVSVPENEIADVVIARVEKDLNLK